MKITLKNDKSVQDKLRELQTLSIEKALRKAALIVERDAKILVPVDTGLLRNSITTSVEGNTAIIGTSIEYAAKVELGINQKRQPFLTPALNMNRERIKKNLQEEIRNEIKRVAK